MTSLAGKKVMVVGGSGYLGSYIGRTLASRGATVYSLSRRGPRKVHSLNAKIKWLIGSSMNIDRFPEAKECDMIVNTVGTLFDTSITKRRQPGQEGTYEHTNRDSFLKVLENSSKNSKVVYISASGHPPFIHRYITTKKQAQDALLSSPNEGYVLRPGMIYSWRERKWSVPIKWSIDGWMWLYPYLSRAFSGKGTLTRLLNEFWMGQPTALPDIADTVSYLLINQNEKKILETEDMKELADKFHQYELKNQKS